MSRFYEEQHIFCEKNYFARYKFLISFLQNDITSCISLSQIMIEVCPIPPLSKEIYGFKVLELIMCLCISHSK